MKSYAKINIGLNILNKRDDGYHNIETIFAPIDLYDEIKLNGASENITIKTENENIPIDENNICHKAIKLLQSHFKIETGIIVEIIKKIPVGAGLGGGSSNAAAVIIEYLKYTRKSISQEDLNKIALELGSDVPYFLKSGPAYARGRGEILDYFNFTIPYWIVVIYPHLFISTKWAYECFIEKTAPVEQNYKNILIENIYNPSNLRKLFFNDFEEIVFKRYPGLISMKNIFYEKGAVYASVSGSGSSLYGFYDSEKNCERAYNAFSNKFKTFITKPDFRVG